MDPGNAFVKSVESNFKRKFRQYHESLEDAPVAAELIAQDPAQ